MEEVSTRKLAALGFTGVMFLLDSLLCSPLLTGHKHSDLTKKTSSSLTPQHLSDEYIRHCWPVSYEDSKVKFRCIAMKLQRDCGARFKSIPLHSQFQNDLTIDVCLIPARNHNDDDRVLNAPLLAHMTGVDGIVDSQIGSCIQIHLLSEIHRIMTMEYDNDDQPSLLNPLKSTPVHYLFIHTVNPFGFKHHRSVNSSNVNLRVNSSSFLIQSNPTSSSSSSSVLPPSSHHCRATLLSQWLSPIDWYIYADLSENEQRLMKSCQSSGLINARRNHTRELIQSLNKHSWKILLWQWIFPWFHTLIYSRWLFEDLKGLSNNLSCMITPEIRMAQSSSPHRLFYRGFRLSRELELISELLSGGEPWIDAFGSDLPLYRRLLKQNKKESRMLIMESTCRPIRMDFQQRCTQSILTTNDDDSSENNSIVLCNGIAKLLKQSTNVSTMMHCVRPLNGVNRINMQSETQWLSSMMSEHIINELRHLRVTNTLLDSHHSNHNSIILESKCTVNNDDQNQDILKQLRSILMESMDLILCECPKDLCRE